MDTEIIENNKAVIYQWLEAWKLGDAAALDRIFARDYTVNGILVGVEGVRQAVRYFHSALTDTSVELKDMVAEGDQVVVRWIVQGLHTGEFMGVAPTGKQLELRGINMYQIVDGKIAANHEETNIPEVIQSLKTGN